MEASIDELKAHAAALAQERDRYYQQMLDANAQWEKAHEAVCEECDNARAERDGAELERETLRTTVATLTAERDAATKHAQILSNGRAEVLATVERLTAERDRYRAALEFYADPENYFGIAFLPDPPCGAFAEDFEEMSGDLSHPDGQPWTKPGKLARAALAPTQKEAQ